MHSRCSGCIESIPVIKSLHFVGVPPSVGIALAFAILCQQNDELYELVLSQTQSQVNISLSTLFSSNGWSWIVRMAEENAYEGAGTPADRAPSPSTSDAPSSTCCSRAAWTDLICNSLPGHCKQIHPPWQKKEWKAKQMCTGCRNHVHVKSRRQRNLWDVCCLSANKRDFKLPTQCFAMIFCNVFLSFDC